MTEKNKEMAAKRQRLESEDLFAKNHQWDEIELKFDDGQSLYVSKGFLAYKSPVFEGMFRSECKEVKNNCVKMKGKDREFFKKILLRMHPRSQKPFKDADIFPVYGIAHEYQIEVICEECEKFFIKKMEIELLNLTFGSSSSSMSLTDLRYPALEKGLDMLDFAKSFSKDKIVFSAYQLISAFPTEYISQHPKFMALSDADKNIVLMCRLARTDHPGRVRGTHLTLPPYFNTVL